MEVLSKNERITLFYGTSETVYFRPETVDVNAHYTLAVKAVRNPAAPAMVLANGSVSGNLVVFEISTFTEAFREVSLRLGRAWLEIHTDDTVLLQREIIVLPRTDVDGDPAPTPVKQYYTKERVDGLLSAIASGVTPHIGQNGNWFLGETDTGVAATGPAGATGAQGPQGTSGATVATGVSVVDNGGYFDGNTVEAALQEVGASLDGLEALLSGI